jgi:hypothetical protein
VGTLAAGGVVRTGGTIEIPKYNFPSFGDFYLCFSNLLFSVIVSKGKLNTEIISTNFPLILYCVIYLFLIVVKHT